MPVHFLNQTVYYAGLLPVYHGDYGSCIKTDLCKMRTSRLKTPPRFLAALRAARNRLEPKPKPNYKG